MPSQQQQLIASAGYWQRLGLTVPEILDRMIGQYPSADQLDIVQAVSMSTMLAQAGQAVQASLSGLPVYGINLPIVLGQASPFEYRTQVPIFDPETERESQITVVIRSNIPLTYAELEARSLQAASIDISKSEYDKAYRGLAGYQPDVLTPNAVQVVSASTWDGPKQTVAFGT